MRSRSPAARSKSRRTAPSFMAVSNPAPGAAPAARWEGPAALAPQVAELETARKDAARRLDFERAAELRDRIKALRKVDIGV